MKNLVLLSLFSILLLTFISCDKRDYRNQENFDELLATQFPDAEPTSEEIKKLRSDLSAVSADLRRMLAQQGRLASFYNALGEEYRRLGMFKPALDAYQASLEIQPLNHVVQYKAGVMAGQLYTLAISGEEKELYLSRAQKHYENALLKTPDHVDSLYALAVLLFFERDNVDAARAVVDRLLLKNESDARTLFLAGRIAAESGDSESAVRYYTRILETSKDDTQKEQAKANLEVIKQR